MSYDVFSKSLGIRSVERLDCQVNMCWKNEIDIIKDITKKENCKILDVGCGTGLFAKKMMCYNKDLIITCVDKDDRMVNYTRKRMNDYIGSNCIVIQGDAAELKFANNQFDIVIARFLFQHLKQPGSVLQEIYRILKPGGAFYIIDIDNDLWGGVSPDCEIFNDYMKKLNIIQSKCLGDRNVMRKIPKLAKRAGFINITNGVHYYSDYDLREFDFFGLKIHDDMDLMRHQMYYSNNNDYKRIFDLIMNDSYEIFLLTFYSIGYKT